MSMYEWAKREVEIACERERAGSTEEGEWDYGCSCYESALKAFNNLCEDGHSGFSIGITKNILDRLIDGKPLTAIEDTNDIWNEVSCSYGLDDDKMTSYQCKRMYSLFKDVYKDGTVKYHDNDQFVCVDINNPNSTYHSGLVGSIIHEMFPITMPYMPANKPIRVFCGDYLTDSKNGDFDTVGILYAVKPDGSQVDINRYFKGDRNDSDWVEISRSDYDDRIQLHIKRLAKEG